MTDGGTTGFANSDASPRRKTLSISKLGRHAIVLLSTLIAGATIYLLLGFSREWWPDRSFGPRSQDVHWKLSVSTGSSAVLLLGVTLAIGPIRAIRQNKQASIHLPWRRVTGIWTALAAWTHVVFGITIHAAGIKIWVPFTHLWESQGRLRLLAMAMFIGLGAALILGLLAATSNSRSMRALGARRWKVLHRSTYLVGALVVLHVFAIQLQERRDLKHVAITASVLVLFASIQAAGFISIKSLAGRSDVMESPSKELL